MNISDNRNITPKVNFDDLNNGDVFEYGGIAHMRISDVLSTLGLVLVNAVKLTTGISVKFNANDLVTPLQHELIINE